MREVDEALAQAYSRRAATVPPRSHLPFHPSQNSPPPAQQLSPRPFSPDPVSLNWPPVIETLERDFSARFALMADRLISARDQRRIKVLLFTSCYRAEGRTTLVLALAKALGRKPGRVVLVDADLTSPMIARSLKLEPITGLDDVVQQGHALSDALIHAFEDNLTILPLRESVAHPRAFLSSPAWSCTLARLRLDFDLVLIDGSPMFVGLTSSVLHRPVDAAVLVHNRTLSGERSLLRAQEVLEGAGIPLLGLAETFVP